MSRDLAKLARTYAQGAFDSAKGKGTLDDWLIFFANMSLAARDANLKVLLQSPVVSRKQKVDLLKELGKAMGDQENFVELLVKYDRFAAIDLMAEYFDELYARMQDRTKVSVVSAFALDDKQKQQIEQALHKSTGQKIECSYEESKELIAGIKLVGSDWVIDASIRGRIDDLAERLMV